MNRAGSYITVLKGKAEYKAYRPNPLPPNPEIELDNQLITLLSKAHNSLGHLDSISSFIPNTDLFLGAYVRKEALLSSQIEGTQATLEDIFNAENDASINIDVNDVINYVNTLNYAVNRMKELPICNRLLCEMHCELMRNVRGQDKNPGEFRRSQNWIGTANSTINNAKYIPPTVEDMYEAIGDLEKFINESDLDILIKTSLVHYQFETIHPFLDGNGRIGRMLIVLMLLNENVLSLPVLYISLYFKTNRIEYYDRLSEVRRTGNYEQWIKFFLNGIIETSQSCYQTITNINNLMLKDEKKIENKNINIKTIFYYLKKHPLISIKLAAKDIGLSYNTVANAVSELIKLNIVSETTNKARNRIFEYNEYMKILRLGIEL